MIGLGGEIMFTYLKELTEIKGPSGFEDDVREYIKSKIKDKVDEIFEELCLVIDDRYTTKFVY